MPKIVYYLLALTVVIHFFHCESHTRAFQQYNNSKLPTKTIEFNWKVDIDDVPANVDLEELSSPLFNSDLNSTWYFSLSVTNNQISVNLKHTTRNETAKTKFSISLKREHFDQLFKLSNGQSGDSEIIMFDVDLHVFEALLKFLYTNELPKSVDIIKRLLVIADRFELKELVQLCEERLVDDLTITNAVEYLELAADIKREQLKAMVFQFIEEHYSSIVFLSEWRVLKKNRPNLIFEYYEAIRT